MSNNMKYSETDVRAEVERTAAVVVDKKNYFIKFLEVCFWIVFNSVKFFLEWARFVSNVWMFAFAIVEALCDSRNVNAANSKQNGKLAPPSPAETKQVDVDGNDVLAVATSEVKLLRSVWGKRSAGRLVHRATPVLPTRATPVLPTRAAPVLPTRASPVLPTRDTPVQATGGSRTCEMAPVVSEKRKVPSAKLDTINDTFKFWKRRFGLFSKFNKGIWLDEESFYSVCPEVISTFMAEQCKSIKIAVDPFCGAGGNIIQLAKFCDKVIACDIDPVKIAMAKHNAAVYGVAHKIEFRVGDFFEICDSIKGDVIVTSPPWGGPNYGSRSTIEPSAILLDRILAVGKSITSKMLLHLPKNLSKFKCVQVCQATGLRVVKMQDVYINKYVNCVLVYVKSNTDNCTDLPRLPQITSVEFQQPFYNDGRNSGKNAYRNYLSHVERSVKIC